MDHSTIPIYFVWIIRDINTIKYNIIFIKQTIPTYTHIQKYGYFRINLGLYVHYYKFVGYLIMSCIFLRFFFFFFSYNK